MTITAVESSALATVGYDESRELLELEFRSGAHYRYSGVPAAVHEALLAAASKGSYFSEAIRPCYPFVRIDEQPLAVGTVTAKTSGSQRGPEWRAR